MQTTEQDLTPIALRYVPFLTNHAASKLPTPFNPPPAYVIPHRSDANACYVAVSKETRELIGKVDTKFNRFVGFNSHGELPVFTYEFEKVPDIDLYLLSIPWLFKPIVRGIAYMQLMQRKGLIADFLIEGAYGKRAAKINDQLKQGVDTPIICVAWTDVHTAERITSAVELTLKSGSLYQVC